MIKINIFDHAPGGSIVTQECVESVLDHIAASGQLSDLEREYIHFTLKKENYPDGNNGYISENAGTFRGLGQFDRKTWNGLIRNGFDLPPYNKGVSTPLYDIQAILYLMRDNERVYINQFHKGKFPSLAVAYLYHNQGAGAAKSFLKGNTLRSPKQSGEALSLFRSIKRENYVTS